MAKKRKPAKKRGHIMTVRCWVPSSVKDCKVAYVAVRAKNGWLRSLEVLDAVNQ